ncbi:MAG: hypothetical protein JW767_11275 [Thermoleophilia bacterium]|nr:hypothetical protein [Thermoleophilia bacterium]
MDGWTLLIVGLVSLAVVFGAFAYLGVRGYHLFRRGLALSRSLAPHVAELDAAGRTIEQRTAQLEADAAALTDSTARLQESVARLQVLTQALNDGIAPYRRVRDYLGGRRG